MISPESKPSVSDRILVLEVMDGKKPMSSLGVVDPSLFKEGGNRLHAVMDPATCLWSFKYDKGSVPPALKGSFTGFRALKKYADNYFHSRNVSVKEVLTEV